MTDLNEQRRELHTHNAELCVRGTQEGGAPGRCIEGYAIRFGTPSLPLYEDGKQTIREVIEREAVTQELLDRSDIKFTLFHDSQLLLARSKNGQGTLTYELREEGVWFRFEAPRTADGDKAVELVRSGVIDGCSFAFSTRYRDSSHVEAVTEERDGRRETVCHVRKMTGIYDMTLTPDPAYPSTTVANRDLPSLLSPEDEEKPDPEIERQIAEMRREAGRSLI